MRGSMRTLTHRRASSRERRGLFAVRIHTASFDAVNILMWPSSRSVQTGHMVVAEASAELSRRFLLSALSRTKSGRPADSSEPSFLPHLVLVFRERAPCGRQAGCHQGDDVHEEPLARALGGRLEEMDGRRSPDQLAREGQEQCGEHVRPRRGIHKWEVGQELVEQERSRGGQLRG